MAYRPRARCELCGSNACVFCPSDDACLCAPCDAKVHGANFLVSRHTRALLCARCQGPTAVRLWGPCPGIPEALCPYCSEAMRWEKGGGGCWWQGRVGVEVGAGVEEVEKAEVRVRRGGDEGEEGGVRVAGFSVSPVSVLSSEDCCSRSQDNESPSFTTSAEFDKAESEESECQGAMESPCGPVTHPILRTLKGEVGQKRKRDSDADDEEKDTCSSSSSTSGNPKELNANVASSHDLITKNRNSSDSNPNDSNQGGLSLQAANRLQRVLNSWQSDLGLACDVGTELAMKFLQKALRKLQPKMKMLAADTLRITLATCLWLSLKLGTEQKGVPKASQVSTVTGVSASRLKSMELQLLCLLDWRPLEGCLEAKEIV